MFVILKIANAQNEAIITSKIWTFVIMQLLDSLRWSCSLRERRIITMDCSKEKDDLIDVIQNEIMATK